MAVFLNNKVGVKINTVDLSDHATAVLTTHELQCHVAPDVGTGFVTSRRDLHFRGFEIRPQGAVPAADGAVATRQMPRLALNSNTHSSAMARGGWHDG